MSIGFYIGFMIGWVLVSFPLLLGFSIAYWQGQAPSIAKQAYRQDVIISIIVSLCLSACGPIGNLVAWALCDGFRHGWQIRYRCRHYLLIQQNHGRLKCRDCGRVFREEPEELHRILP